MEHTGNFFWSCYHSLFADLCPSLSRYLFHCLTFHTVSLSASPVSVLKLTLTTVSIWGLWPFHPMSLRVRLTLLASSYIRCPLKDFSDNNSICADICTRFSAWLKLRSLTGWRHTKPKYRAALWEQQWKLMTTKWIHGSLCFLFAELTFSVYICNKCAWQTENLNY